MRLAREPHGERRGSRRLAPLLHWPLYLSWRDESASLHTSGSRLCLFPRSLPRWRSSSEKWRCWADREGHLCKHPAGTESQSDNIVAAAAPLQVWCLRSTLLLSYWDTWPKTEISNLFFFCRLPVSFCNPDNSSGVSQRQRIPHSRSWYSLWRWSVILEKFNGCGYNKVKQFNKRVKMSKYIF